MFFTHNTQNSLLLLIHVQVQCDLAITRFTCVNVCSLNCLALIPGGLIEQVPASMIASRHLMDRSRFCSWSGIFVPRYFLDTCICWRAFSRHLPRQMARHLSTPYLSRFTKDLFKLPRVIRSSFLSISLSIALCFLSQTLSSHSNLVS